MEICVLTFNRNIRWKIAESDPLLFRLRSHPEVQLISPFLFDEIQAQMDGKRIRPESWPFGGSIGELRLLETDGIAFVVDDHAVGRHKPETEGRFDFIHLQAPLVDIFTPLLSAFRHLSKQSDLPKGADDVNIWAWLKLDKLPVIPTLSSSNIRTSVATKIVETAITKEDIEKACSDSDFIPPIFDTLMLDAISAHEEHDYRKSILYSAIALETAAGAVLDDSYEMQRKESISPNWRMVDFTQAGGQVIRKDPIWMVLRKREDANSLLHEGALYILGRSLLIENQPLYQLMERLRATRNKIVHLGEPPEPNADKYLSIDSGGSSDALNCADQILGWLGVGSEYKLHAAGFVALSSPPVSES